MPSKRSSTPAGALIAEHGQAHRRAMITVEEDSEFI
jgi:hypothetical protein